MGVDIDGFIEVRPWPSWPDLPHEIEWEAAACLDCLYATRDHDAFGCLFGVMNHAGFRPVAADRGLPSDASEQVRRSFSDADPQPPAAAPLRAAARAYDTALSQLIRQSGLAA